MGNYPFNAIQLAQRRFNPQLGHMGMMEFHIDDLVSGGKEILALGLANFSFPSPRKVSPVTVNYLNGVIRYPGKPGPIEGFSATFVDYIDGRQREILHSWFDYVYDERTGVGGLPAQIKVDAHALLFGPDGIERASYLLYGVWPEGDPPLPGIDFGGGGGGVVEMQMQFSVDFIEEEFVNRQGTSGGAQGSGFGSLGALESRQAALQG
jgi:hypothetical protein